MTTDVTLIGALLAAIGALATAVGRLFFDLRKRSAECEQERKELQRQALADAQRFLSALEKVRGANSRHPPSS